ncbi:SIN3-like 5 [Striga asiatica]|uniref:SIN3-like 5 n=1 Tax=Striga asiatica TaxID=4170 RepID=A0A5A7QK18_STRAF|nr:SIN3-like 5 [Striga asiatica]
MGSKDIVPILKSNSPTPKSSPAKRVIDSDNSENSLLKPSCLVEVSIQAQPGSLNIPASINHHTTSFTEQGTPLIPDPINQSKGAEMEPNNNKKIDDVPIPEIAHNMDIEGVHPATVHNTRKWKRATPNKDKTQNSLSIPKAPTNKHSQKRDEPEFIGF